MKKIAEFKLSLSERPQSISMSTDAEILYLERIGRKNVLYAIVTPERAERLRTFVWLKPGEPTGEFGMHFVGKIEVDGGPVFLFESTI